MPRHQSPLLKFWQQSQTKVWSFAQLAGSGVLASVGEINRWVTDPQFKSYLDEVDVPKSVVIALATIGLLTYLFHGHGDD